MIKLRLLLLCFCVLIASQNTFSQNITVDQWMQLSHPIKPSQFNYSNNNIWWNNQQSITSYHPENGEFVIYNKSNKLTDAHIQYFAIHPTQNIIIVIYITGRIDLVEDTQTHTIYDWETNSQWNNKIVKNINFYNNEVLITTENSVIILDLPSKTFKVTINAQNAFTSFYYQNQLAIAKHGELKFFNNINDTYIHPYPYTIATSEHILLYDSTSIARYHQNKIDTISVFQNEKIIDALQINGKIYFVVDNNTSKVIYEFNQSLTERIHFPSTTVTNDIILFKNKWYGINDEKLFLLNNAEQALLSFNYPSKYPLNNITIYKDEIYVNDDHHLFTTNAFQEWNKIMNDSIHNLLSTEQNLYVLLKNESIKIFSNNGTTQIDYPFTETIISSGINKKGEIFILTEGRIWKLDRNAQWKSYNLPFILNHSNTMYVDDYDNNWIADSTNGLLLIRFASNGTNEVFTKEFSTQNGNLPSNNILSIMMDKFGILWIGTNDGIYYLPCSETIGNGSSDCSFTPALVTENNNTYRLLSGESIHSIIEDGANRKWIGTHNGLFLLNENATQMLQYFNKNNSELISNKIFGLNLIHEKGFLVINTDQGISLLKQSAEKRNPTGSPLMVYPNPVSMMQHDFVAIRNIPENSTIKILNINGQLVKELKATGSQLVWYFKNDKINTGVYIAVIQTPQSKKTVQAKIFITP